MMVSLQWCDFDELVELELGSARGLHTDGVKRADLFVDVETVNEAVAYVKIAKVSAVFHGSFSSCRARSPRKPSTLGLQKTLRIKKSYCK
jgi:hypothetical protein